MREDVLILPTEQVEGCTHREKVEAGLRQLEPPFAPQPGLQGILQGVEVEHVGRRIFNLGLRQTVGAPIGGLLLFVIMIVV